MGTITEPTEVMWDLVDAYEAEFPSAVFSGINGDAAHQTSPGKHLSWSQNRDKFGSNCWPLQAPNDKNAKVKDKAVAVDISMSRTDQNRCHNNFKKIYNNRANDPRAKFIYAFNGWNGEGYPYRYNLYTGAKGKTDNTHTWHQHQEGYYAFVNDPEFVRASRSAFRGETVAQYEGDDDMTPEQDALLRQIANDAKNANIYGWKGLTQLDPTVENIKGNQGQDVTITNYFATKFLEMHAVIMGGADPATLEAIKEAARQGATEGAADVDAIVAGVLAGLSNAGLSEGQKEDVASVMHEVLPQYVGPPVQPVRPES